MSLFKTYRKSEPSDLGAPVAVALQNVGTLVAEAVQLDDAGLVRAFRILPYGPFTGKQKGLPFHGNLQPDHAAAMVATQQERGIRIPFDVQHALYLLSKKTGRSEAEIAAVIGGQSYCVARGDLAAEADGLWVRDIQWTDIGEDLAKEGLWSHYSPVFRDILSDSPCLTSITLTNDPALNELAQIAAEADEADDESVDLDAVALEAISTKLEAGAMPPAAGGKASPRTPAREGGGKDGGGTDLAASAASSGSAALPSASADTLASLSASAPLREANRKGQTMPSALLKLLARITGADSVALTAEGEAPPELTAALEQVATELPELRGIASDVRDCLALEADAPAATITGKLRAMQAKADQVVALEADVKDLKSKAEADAKTKLIEQGMAEGKLTKAQVDGWIANTTSAALEAFLETAPKVIEVGESNTTKDLPEDDDVALTAGQEAVAEAMGKTPEQMKKALKNYKTA